MQAETADQLLRKVFREELSASQWSDLGCGKGFFTEALARQLSSGSKIYAVDKKNNLSMRSSSETQVEFQLADFEKDVLELPKLNGILMANSLHFVEDKKKLIRKLNQYLLENGKFLIIEYDTDKANPWAPYPTSFANLKKLFSEAGFTSIEKIAETPSLYGSGMMYSCLIKKS